MASPAASPTSFEGHAFADDVVFDEETFAPDTCFRGARFSGHVSFAGARFLGAVSFAGAVFERDAWFGHVRFDDEATFDDTRFEGTAGFGGARFGGQASFSYAAFSGDALFGGVRVRGDACFSGAHFAADAAFEDALFWGRADFVQARFERAATFDGGVFLDVADFSCSRFEGRPALHEVAFLDEALFKHARFADLSDIGPLIAHELTFDRAEFEQPAQLSMSCRSVSLRGAVFRGGADIHARWAVLDLEEADFGARPSLIAHLERQSGPEPLLGREEPVELDVWTCPIQRSELDHRPSISSVEHARVEGLRISGADLRSCRFVGAHGLERLRLERSEFSRTPVGRHRRAAERSRIRWTDRQTLADEHIWRTQVRGAAGWDGAVDSVSHVPHAEEIGAAYRSLRKGREESKDEPGAADFYYGEMEMRRAHGGKGGGDAALLWLYWLVSGYALRPGRAITAFCVTVLVFAALFWWIGFRDPGFTPRPASIAPSGAVRYTLAPADREVFDSVTESVTFSAGTATAVLAAPDRPLQPAGSILRLVLRILGPVLFGVALLSVRSRVKR